MTCEKTGAVIILEFVTCFNARPSPDPPNNRRPSLTQTTQSFTILFCFVENTMGQPTAGSAAPEESLTVRDNRTGKVYNIPYVHIYFQSTFFCH